MFNKVILMGRLVADPELRQTPSNVSTCKFTVAVDRPYSTGGEKKADFISCNAWRQSAEFVSKWFKKGSLIIVEGSLQNNDYTDKNDVKHYGMIINVENIKFGGSKSSGGETESLTNSNVNNKPTKESTQIGDLNDFEEILSDGDVPF